MIKASIKTLAKVINSARQGGPGSFAGLSIDSRTVEPGQCFFAIKGENFDGHDFVSQALARGAACAVVEHSYAGENSENLLPVADTLTALAELARWYRRENAFKVVAITGSVGKTTTRHMTAAVLAKKYKTHQSPANFNNNIGLPLTILTAEAEAEIIVAELGTNSPGEIEYLAKIAQPDIAVVTTVKPAHMAGFETFQQLLAEKLSIASALDAGGTLLAPAELLQAPQRPPGPYRLRKIPQIPLDVSFSLKSASFSVENCPIELPLPGPGNVANALAAWAICQSFQITPKQFAQALAELGPVEMRTEIIETDDLTIINDCYNASPASMENALNMLAQLETPPGGRKVLICGDMDELGGETELFHKQMGKIAAKADPALILAVGGLAALMARSAQRHRPAIYAEFFANTDALCDNLGKYLRKYDIVLIKASRSARLERAVDIIKNREINAAGLK